MRKVRILNIDFDCVTQQELLERFSKGVLVTPNVDHLVKVQTDREYYEIAKRAEWCVCDSRVLYLCSKLLRTPLPEAVSGSSFFTAFYEYHKADENCRIFILGALDDRAREAMERINHRVGRGIVVGAYSPSWGFEKKDVENDQICEMINASGANAVLVGVGCPKQEKWIDKHKSRMPGVDIWMALGATVDFEAGRLKRAPKIWRKMCLEWLYRFIQAPRHLFKRYFVDDPKFFLLLFKQLTGRYSDPFEEQVIP